MATAQSPSAANPSPNELVRRVVAHELKADSEDRTHWMYRDVANLPAPAKEQTVVETANGNLTCLDEVGSRPLTSEERRAEADRIHDFVADASAQRRAIKASSADDEKTARLFAILPDAFLFKVVDRRGDTVKLSFEPNPAFRTHSMEELVLHRMSGFILVNTREDRLVEIAGTLTHGVEFGGGLLGHLDPGGTFDVQLVEVARDVWRVSRLKVNMRGKVLFFKTVGDQEDETRRDFHQVPDSISLTQAEQLLASQQKPNPAGGKRS